jgi:hypothetical protein
VGGAATPLLAPHGRRDPDAGHRTRGKMPDKMRGQSRHSPILSALNVGNRKTHDGLSLVPYKGPDVWQMSVTNELHKLAGNIGMGRDFAGIHWRSDYDQALLLGEAVAISILRDQGATFSEKFAGFTFTKFDGTPMTV